MSERNRGAFIAGGLVAGFLLGLGLALLFLAWAVPEFRNPSYEQIAQVAANHQDSSKQTEESSQKPEWQYWAERFIGLEDTPAQWLMAVFAVVATGVSIYGVRLLQQTLEATRLATSAAMDGAKAANAASAAAASSLILDQRPWVQIVDARLMGAAYIEAENLRFHIAVVLKVRNVGKTPAAFVHPRYEGFIMGDPEANTAIARLLANNAAERLPGFGTLIFPNAEADVYVDATIINREQRGTGIVLISGFVDYTLVFGDMGQRQTTFEIIALRKDATASFPLDEPDMFPADRVQVTVSSFGKYAT